MESYKAYFVRHGLSQANLEGVYQDADDKLSETGRKQAEIVAKHLRRFPIDLLIASPLQRAKETANIINLELKKDLVFTPLLMENRNPKEIVGLTYDNPKALKIKAKMHKHYLDPKWYHSGEENIFDVMERAGMFLRMLDNYQEKNILVVTHGMIMKMILAKMMFGKELTPDLFLEFDKFVSINNTGITVCERGNGWHLLTLNDYAHLNTA